MTCQMSLKLIPRSRPLDCARGQGRNEQRATAALVILILLLGAASAWVAAAMSPSAAPVAISKKARAPVTQPFEYFPSRYLSQAGPPEEHIEAF